MAASITLNVELNEAKAKAGLEAIAAAIKPLTTPVKLDVDTKAALDGLKDLNTIASNLEKKLNKGFGNEYDASIRKAEAASKAFSAQLRQQMQAEQEAASARKGLASSYNVIDQAIQTSEAAGRNFAAQLREQMQAEQEAEAANKGLASSYNVIDQAIHANEAAGRAFSAQLRQQMQAEVDAEKEAKNTAGGIREMGSAASEATGGFNALQVALGNIASRAFHLAFMKIRQAVREAIDEMKNVDTELTNISKVSGKTGDELTAIGDKAYDTASKYGVAASEYLASVYDMQKAGMGDQAEAMGELAIKTMLVGDTTQEVASKFLIATNAAWKLDGNMERLNQIVDEADYINNNYATTLDKLAAGMPIVASVAENAGMSAEETIAALGTITAATQESGTKAATALRALILNISGQVGSYITEEGEQIDVTKESVDQMKELMKKYASAELEAAKAAGEMIDPMVAIRALFKGMANDDLNDVQMFQLLSGFGGKLRTNQLTALVKNFESLYTDMLGHMENAAGTADSEIGLMMGSWEKKSQVLKNTWTEFIADIADTQTIKNAIDGLTGFVEKLDEIVTRGSDPDFFFSGQTQGEIDDTTKKVKELRDALAELVITRTGDPAQLEELKRELEYNEKILEIKKKQYNLEHQAEAEALQKKLTRELYDDLGRQIQGVGGQADTWQNYMIGKDTENLFFKGSISEYQQDLQGILDKYKEYYDDVIKVRDADIELTDAQKDFVEYYEAVDAVSKDTSLTLGSVVDGYMQIVDAQGNVVAVAKDYMAELDKQEAALDEGVLPVQKELAEQYDYLKESLASIVEPLTEGEFADQVGMLVETFAEMPSALATAFEPITQIYQDYLDSINNAQANTEALEAAEAGATAGAEETASAAEGIQGPIDSAVDSTQELAGAARTAAAAFAAISLGPLGNLAFGGGMAEGTKNAPGGATLVNELGPELISDRGHAYIANGGMPAIVNLHHGAIVLTAEETEQALGGRRGINRKIGAAAKGKKNQRVVGDPTATVTTSNTGNSNAFFTGQGKTVTTATSRINPSNPLDLRVTIADSSYTQPKNSGSISTGGAEAGLSKGKKLLISEKDLKGKGVMSAYGAGAGAGGGGKSAADLLKEAAKDNKDILSNLEKQAKLADNKGEYEKEAEIYGKAQTEIDKMIAVYRKAGYKDTSDEILDLMNKRYDYEKKKDAASKKRLEEYAKDVKDKLSNLDKQAKLAETNGDYVSEVKYYEKAQEEIKKLVEAYRKAGYADDSTEIVDLLQKNVDYAEKQVKVYKDRFNDLIDALEADAEAQEVANRLAEKEQALAEARDALANANKQRTIRTYNAATGQWEWVADTAKIKSAEEALNKAEKDYAEEVKDQAISELERLRDTMADLNDVILGPALSAIMLKAESSEEFQNFARALNAVYGVGSYLSSTQGSSKVLSTSDSHDTIYTFGNVTLTEDEASSMSVAQLAQRLQVLKIS